jgi:hypothetical protein
MGKTEKEAACTKAFKRWIEKVCCRCDIDSDAAPLVTEAFACGFEQGISYEASRVAASINRIIASTKLPSRK